MSFSSSNNPENIAKNITLGYRDALRSSLAIRTKLIETIKCEPTNKEKIASLEKEYEKSSEKLRKFEQGYFAA